jgi:hypothetical protein
MAHEINDIAAIAVSIVDTFLISLMPRR